MDFSKLQLGTVQFGLNYGIANTSGKPAYESARDIIAAAYASGINTLDTAAAYGDSEKILGRALKELDLKDKLQVISKVPPVSDQKLSDYEAEKFINKSIETSLERLGLNSLTAALFHREEDFKYISILKKIEQAGLIKGAGVSIDTNNFCDAILKAGIKYIQLPYNILDKRFDCFFPEASKANIKIFTRSLYLQGLLVKPEYPCRNYVHGSY
jgi:aryl-alcohol dehydrogenase-like predicted oxidoreductase